MRKASRYLPALLLLLVVGVAAPGCAARIYATSRGGYSQDFERRAYDVGFRDGRDRGIDDSRHGRDYSYSRHGVYRDADHGFRRGDGDHGAYRDTFRRGFEAGYSQGFGHRRYGR